jgi:hypothetical protein
MVITAKDLRRPCYDEARGPSRHDCRLPLSRRASRQVANWLAGAQRCHTPGLPTARAERLTPRNWHGAAGDFDVARRG